MIFSLFHSGCPGNNWRIVCGVNTWLTSLKEEKVSGDQERKRKGWKTNSLSHVYVSSLSIISSWRSWWKPLQLPASQGFHSGRVSRWLTVEVSSLNRPIIISMQPVTLSSSLQSKAAETWRMCFFLFQAPLLPLLSAFLTTEGCGREGKHKAKFVTVISCPPPSFIVIDLLLTTFKPTNTR